ncbi:hypothetical protein B7486_55575 [cyanobacterium TDX16]|nr:hypothetical protein B7486_55575 [cyanobacterium TDX16]
MPGAARTLGAGMTTSGARPVTVVVPAHGDAAVVQPLLDELGRQAEGGPPLAVVLSDDASPTPLEEGIRVPTSLDLQVVRSEVNGGPGAARNRGLLLVQTDAVAFLDADTVPGPGWLDRVEELVSRPDGPVWVEGRTRIPAEEKPTPFTHATEATPPEQHVAGNLVFRTAVLREAGGFDERFYDPVRRIHFREDAELSFRLEALGVASTYDPTLLVDHPPLPSAFWGPVRLARRYHFDPLLDREHPVAFRAMNSRRTVGPVTLRRARHDAAVAYVLGLVLVVVGLATWWPLAAAGGVLAIAGWLATSVALAWRRRVGLVHVVPLFVVAAVVPFVYLWHWWRGVVRFRHRPRL